MVMKALYHAVCVLKTGSRKTIVYLPSQADCDRYMEISRDVFENYHGLTVWTGKITAEVSKERRKAILNEFQQDNTNAIHILTSVRILDEAVDIPACDSVFITTIGETTSDIRFFQRAQRGSTLDPKNPNKRNNIFLWADGWEKCVGALDFLRQADPEYHRKVHVAGVNYADHEGREHERKERMLKEATAFGQWSQMACVSLEERLVRKANALVRWVDKENRVPKKKEVDGLNIGKFWNRVKEGHCKTVYDSILSQNELLRADYDRMVKEREEKVGKTVLSPEEKARTLVRWVDEKKRMPKITEEVDGWNIGHFWNAVKQGKSKSVYESILSQNKLLRTNYEKTMKRREAKIGKPVLSPEEKANALVSWVDEKKRVPKTHEVDSWNIGFFWTNVKQGHCKSVYESILTQNELLRADYDKTMKEREAKVGKTILSPEEKARTLVRWVDKENRVPKRTKDVDGWNISQFWTNVKHGQCKSVYDSILSKNDVLRVDYEKTMKKREAKIGTVLSPEEKANAMVRWVDKENRVPKQSDKVDGTNIGHFWNKVKQGKSQSVYESILSQNELLRTDYEKTMKKREVKMAHTTNSVP
jgi:predicted ArsR family transcriptional regulator